MLDYYYMAQQPYYKPVCEYSQQEEEWDREGLLDPAWERQQKKTFTAWCNSHLRKAGTGIEAIEEDFQNGLKLMLLLEVISGETLGRPDRGKLRFHQIANVNKALEYIESKGVKLVSIGAEEIVDGNVKMTLGLIWTIILRFAIQNINVGELSARDGLLLWCQRKTAPYDNVNVQNFTTSWKDGLAFCALIHRHRPELIDYSQLGRRDPVSNLNLAFDIAEKHLDIPKMLDAEVMVGTASPDEKAIMTYVSSYYHCFLNMNKATTAAKRICRVLNLTRESEQLMGEYDEIVTNILDWIDKWLPRLRDRSTTANESVEAMRRRMDEFRQYRCVEKPPRVEEKGRLETLFSTVQTKLRLNNRPAFAPTEGRLIKDVNKAWQCLEQAENGFEEWLQNEINRLERLDLLAEKFYQKCKVHQEWMDGKEERLKSTDYLCSDFYRIKALRKRQEAFESDFAAHEERVVQIKGISAELADNGYHDITTVRQRCSAVEAEWERMRELSSRRSESLEQAERTLERLDNFHLAFAKRVVPFNNWLDSARDDLTEVMVRPCGEEIDRLMDAFNAFRQTLVDAHKEFHQIQEFHRDIVEVVVTNRLHNELLKNPYTDLSPEGIIKKWKDVQALVPEREKNLRSEQSKSRTNELLHQSFADKANQMGPWMEAKLQEVLKIGMGLSGGLEDSVTQLKAIHKEVQSRRANLDELERVNRELQEKFVNVSTKESRYSMESLRVAWEHLLTSVNRVISECENQVLLRDSKNIKEELLSEYRSSFNHFDKERLGLNDEQLKACLISVGYNLRGSAANGRRDIGVEDIRGIMARVDPNGTGRVQFDAFLDFMTSETADSDTADQLISSFRVLSNGKSEIDAETIRLELPTEYADYLIEKMTNYRITTAAKKTADTFAYTTFSKELYS